VFCFSIPDLVFSHYSLFLEFGNSVLTKLTFYGRSAAKFKISTQRKCDISRSNQDLFSNHHSFQFVMFFQNKLFPK